MLQYIIRRLLLMIPTFLGTTFLVFVILQLAPDGPFERAVKQLKEANMGSEGGGHSGSVVSSQALTPELLDELGITLRLEDATKKYAESIGKSAKELNTYQRSQAVLIETQRQYKTISEVWTLLLTRSFACQKFLMIL